MNDMSDDELRTRFSALRNQDRRHEPQFSELWNRAEPAAPAAARPYAPTFRWIAAAAGIALAAALVVSKSRESRNHQLIVTTVPSISDWQSPTAGLLQAPSRDLLAPPSLLSSVFDGVTQTAVQSKTD